MKIQLMIATADADYAKHLSRVVIERHSDTFEVGICSSRERLAGMLDRQHYDVALLSPEMATGDAKKVGLPLLLWDEAESREPGIEQLDVVRKYQRVSTLISEILEKYADVAGKRRTPDFGRAHITAVWSPVGGAGKTTVALAFAARQVADGRATTYLDLESFSSTPVYFANDGKSISEAFEKLGSNLELLMHSIRMQDASSGIYYFCAPRNYDDINVLTNENLQEIILAAGHGMDEVVLDLSSVCDSRIRFLLEEADSVFIVVDGSRRGAVKWAQFEEQHDVFAHIRDKVVLIRNMGAQVDGEGVRCLTLPYVRSDSPASVYKSLSGSDFHG